AMVFTGKGHAVRPPGQEAAVPHQHGRMTRPGMGIAGQFRGTLHHVLRLVTVLARQWPPLGPRLLLHTSTLSPDRLHSAASAWSGRTARPSNPVVWHARCQPANQAVATVGEHRPAL